jgi:hypothetical protein
MDEEPNKVHLFVGPARSLQVVASGLSAFGSCPMQDQREVSRQELAEAVLDLLRQRRGFETVSDVGISEINDPEAGSNWRASVLEKHHDDALDVKRAVEEIQGELRPLYRLRSESA